MRPKPFHGAWWEASSSRLSGLSRVCGSTNERDETDPRTRQTASESPFPHTMVPPLSRRHSMHDEGMDQADLKNGRRISHLDSFFLAA